jgi:hypothetical protein
LSGSIFLRRGADLVEMVERRYDSEDVLQELLARYPNLLARDQVEPGEARRWLLVTREGGIPDREGGPDRWSIDHVFLDQDSVPTLVEVKRSTDTRIRREVVGQLLDYAANILAFWSVQRIRDAFEERCRREDIEPGTELMTVLGETAPDDYWERVKTNLEARRLRLVSALARSRPSSSRRGHTARWRSTSNTCPAGRLLTRPNGASFWSGSTERQTATSRQPSCRIVRRSRWRR